MKTYTRLSLTQQQLKHRAMLFVNSYLRHRLNCTCTCKFYYFRTCKERKNSKKSPNYIILKFYKFQFIVAVHISISFSRSAIFTEQVVFLINSLAPVRRYLLFKYASQPEIAKKGRKLGTPHPPPLHQVGYIGSIVRYFACSRADKKSELMLTRRVTASV